MEGALGSRDPPGKEASELCVPQHLPEGSGPRRACELASERRRWEHPWDAPLAPLLTGWGPSELNTCCTCHLVVFRMICRKRCQRSKAAAHSAEQQSLCSVRPESAKAAACGRARSPRVGAWSDPQTHRVWLWTARRERVTRWPTDTPRPTACLTHGGQGRVPRKGPRSPTRFWKQTILPNYTNSAHVQRHGLERWPGWDCHPPLEVRGF